MSDYNATVNVSTSSKLNVRKGPGTTHAIIGARYRGDTVRVTHHDGVWRKIAWSAGQHAYVHGNYLQSRSLDAAPPDSSTEDKTGNPYAATDAGSLDMTTGNDNPYDAADQGSLNSGSTSGKPSCENPRQCDGAAGDPSADRRDSTQPPW